MPIDNPVDISDCTYCSSEDVAGELLKPDNYFTSETTPSLFRVNKKILQAEEYIDKQTRRAWRVRKRSNEYFDLHKNQERHSRAGIKIKLSRRFIKSLDSGEGDSLELWNGSEYVNYLSTYTEGRNADYWLDYEEGYLYLTRVLPRALEKVGRITYRYGETTVPLDIQDITAKMVAMNIINHEDNSFILDDAGNSDSMQYDPRISNMRRYVKLVLSEYADFGYTL